MINYDEKNRILFEVFKSDKDRDDTIEYFVSTQISPLHWHDFYEIEYIISGSGLNIMNGEKIELKSGSLFIVDPTDFHEVIPTPSLELIHVRFDDCDISDKILQKLYPYMNNLNIILTDNQKEVTENLLRTLIKIRKAVSNNDNYVNIKKRILECVLLQIIDFCEKNEYKNTKSVNDDVMQKALTYIQRNFKNKINLSDVSKYVNISPNYFSKMFHETIGVTFKTYVINQKMSFARKLLLNSDFMITEIAYEIGYTSLTSFCRDFKNRFGVSPIEYKKSKK